MSEDKKIRKPRKTKSEYNRTYYEKKKDKLITNGCTKTECPNCLKVISKNNLRCHLKTKLCAKRIMKKTEEKICHTNI
jgi:hypothetical protein